MYYTNNINNNKKGNEIKFISTNEKVDYINQLLQNKENIELDFKINESHVFLEIKEHKDVFKTNNILNGFGYLPIDRNSILFISDLISKGNKARISSLIKNQLASFIKNKEASIYIELDN